MFIKLIAAMVSMAALLILSPFSSLQKEPVKVIQEVPKQVPTDSSFLVTLKIHGSGITGFARLQQYLPAGFTAEAMETGNADFIFDANSVRFIWTKFPDKEEVTVSYKVTADASVKGRQLIYGIFIYIDDEQTVKLPLDPSEFTIGTEEVNPQISRKLTSISPENGEYRVELTIDPNNLNTAAKFIDQIPEGFVASSENSNGAAFSFDDNKAIFNWKKFPSDSVFTISYVVKSNSASLPPAIEGVFVYGNDEGNSKTEDEPVTAAENSKEELIANTTNNSNTVTASIDKQPNTIMQAKPTAAGLLYRVQICATQKSKAKDSKYFEDKYAVSPPVELTYHEGWRKYIIGSFSSYKEASVFKTETRKTVGDAFVVAYSNGERIPVAEARKKVSLNQ